MNIQHLESLYDMVERFTGVKVKERVPDYVLAEADQIVNVDVSAEDLQERMRAGKIYPPERAERALANFFTEANLTPAARAGPGRDRPGARPPPAAAGRQRAGRRQRAGHGLPQFRSPERRPAAAQGGPAGRPVQRPVVRRLRRRRRRERTEKVDAATQRRLSDALALAQQLGGVAMPYKGRTSPGTVADLVREYGITHVVVGRSQRPWYRRLFRPVAAGPAAAGRAGRGRGGGGYGVTTPGRSRTCDLRFRKPPLYPLSYGG